MANATSIKRLIDTYDTLPDNFKAVAKTDIEKYNKIIYYRPPQMYMPVYNAFWAIRQTKTIEHPLTYTDIKDYIYLSTIKLAPNEVEILLRLDWAYRDQYYEVIK